MGNLHGSHRRVIDSANTWTDSYRRFQRRFLARYSGTEVPKRLQSGTSTVDGKRAMGKRAAKKGKAGKSRVVRERQSAPEKAEDVESVGQKRKAIADPPASEQRSRKRAKVYNGLGAENTAQVADAQSPVFGTAGAKLKVDQKGEISKPVEDDVHASVFSPTKKRTREQPSPKKEGVPDLFAVKGHTPSEDSPVGCLEGSPKRLGDKAESRPLRQSKRGRGSYLVETVRSGSGAAAGHAGVEGAPSDHGDVQPAVEGSVLKAKRPDKATEPSASAGTVDVAAKAEGVSKNMLRKRRLLFGGDAEPKPQQVNTAEIIRQRVKTLNEEEEREAGAERAEVKPILKAPPASEEEEAARKLHGRTVDFSRVDVWEFPRAMGTGGVPYEGGASLGLGWSRLQELQMNINFFEARRRRRKRMCREMYAHIGHKSEEERIQMLGDAVKPRDVRIEQKQLDKLREKRSESAEDIAPQQYVEELRMAWCDDDDIIDFDELVGRDQEWLEQQAALEMENGGGFGGVPVHVYFPDDDDAEQ